MKTKPIFIILVSLVMVSACGPSIVTPSPQPTSTTTSTLTSTQTPTETNKPTVTPLPFAYELKQVLLEYYLVGWHTLFDLAVEHRSSRLVIYSDGQIIISGETKKLSHAEMDQLFSQFNTFAKKGAKKVGLFE